jgi:hypothetical protein
VWTTPIVSPPYGAILNPRISFPSYSPETVIVPLIELGAASATIDLWMPIG